MKPHGRSTATGPTIEDITAVEMAREAEIDPKAFRSALRKQGLAWHHPGDRWTVRRGGKQHAEMQGVLDHLLSN